VDYYRNQGKLACVHGVGSMDEVFTRIVAAISPTSEVG
jgi:adenylate kinase